MKRITSPLLFLFLVLTFSCQNNASKERADAGNQVQMEADVKEAPPEPVDLKLIKEGTVAFETESINETRKIILKAVERYKGYISSEQEIKHPSRYSTTLVIRVPAANFDILLNDATSGVERFETKEITVHDVSEEYVDIAARVKTKKELENRFIELLKKSKTVTEAIEIEKQIAALRGEIESIEGRMRYLDNRVSLSTLTMVINEPIEGESELGRRFSDAFGRGLDILTGFFVFLINIWPFLLIGALAVFGLRVYRRRKAGRPAQ